MYKRKKSIRIEASLLCILVGLPSLLEGVLSRMYYPLFFLIKLNYTTAPPIASNFCCGKTEPRKLHAAPTSTVPFLGFNLAETTSVRPCKAEVKHSRSPTRRKLLWQKLNVKKTQRSASDKKPSVLANGAAQTADGKWGSHNRQQMANGAAMTDSRKLTWQGLRLQEASR